MPAANKRRLSEPTAGSRTPKKPRVTLDSFFTREVQHGLTQPVRKTTESKGPTETTPKSRSVLLSLEQNAVINAVMNGRSVFFTGAAGTGKSLLLRHIIEKLRKKHAKSPDAVAITASTGMAATNIGGMTIHSWGAVAPGTQDVDTLITYIRKCPPALKRWRSVKALVIDEISMVDGYLFERLCEIAAKLRKKTDKPFGGIQLILTGDFFQLPPIMNFKTSSQPPANGSTSKPASSSGHKQIIPSFAFESDAWTKCIDDTFNLKEVFRQKGDDKLISLLNALRKGTLSKEQIDLLRSLSRSLPPTIPDITPTELFPLRAQVNASNASFLEKLPGQLRRFKARDTFPGVEKKKKPAPKKKGRKKKGEEEVVEEPEPTRAPPSPHLQKLLENVMALDMLELKEGAQVMLVKNIDRDGSVGGLVNGCVGKVVGFCTREKLLGKGGKGAKNGAGMVRGVVIGDDGVARINTEAEKENREEFEEEKVADDKETPKATEVVAPNQPFPLVEFAITVIKGKKKVRDTEVVLVCRDEFRVEDSDGNLLARRMQVPLILAWAMSIHKSQGQTIERVKVDLSRVFEDGQTYVALSRVTSLEGLQVLRFDPGKVKVNQTVVEWSRGLEGNDEPDEVDIKMEEKDDAEQQDDEEQDFYDLPFPNYGLPE